MSSIEKTAYPRFPKRRKIKSTELSNSYSLRDDEIKMIKLAAKTDKSRFNLAIQLKAFQRLGYSSALKKTDPLLLKKIDPLNAQNLP